MSEALDVEPARRSAPDEAIVRVLGRSRSRQHADGHWGGLVHAGVVPTVIWVLGLRYVADRGIDVASIMTPSRTAAVVSALAGAQHDDGGFPSYPGAPSSCPDTTAVCEAALGICGCPPSDPRRRAARAYLGRDARPLEPLTRVLLAMGDRTRADAWVTPPAWTLLIPGCARGLERLGFGGAMAAYLLLPILDALGVDRAPRRWRRVVAPRVAAAVARYLRARQDADGNFAGISMLTVLACASLAATGMRAEDPLLGRALARLDAAAHVGPSGELWVEPFSAEVWNTAHALWVHAEAASPGSDPEHRERLARAVRWLLERQHRRPAPRDWQSPPEHAPRTGGWAFERGSDRAPDCDTTAMVLMALHRTKGVGLPPRLAARVDAAIERGCAWLRAMQNPDGGWAAFCWGQPEPPPRVLRYRRPSGLRDLWGWLREQRAAVADPSTAELTGRILAVLGALGHTTDDRVVRDAALFLRRQQVDGVWWGRWSINYVPATADVLLGLAAVGVDPEQPWVRLAIEALSRWQNADGGWGETPASYRSFEHAGRGPSSVFPTAQAARAMRAMALRIDVDDRSASRIAARCALTQAADRGVEWLVGDLGSSGTWSVPECIGVIVVPALLYANETHAQHVAALALLGARGAGPVSARRSASASRRSSARDEHPRPYPVTPGSTLYRFDCTLTFDASIETIWEILTDIEQWPGWWSGFIVSACTPARGGLLEGRVFEVTFPTALGYGLTIRYAVTRAQPPHTLVAVVEGQLEGMGAFSLTSVPSGTRVEFRWEVATTRRWMNAVGRIGCPLLLWNHDRVQRWFAERLAARAGCRLLALESRLRGIERRPA